MSGLLITIIWIVFFAFGFVVGTILVTAIVIHVEDKAAQDRQDGSILLHEEPQGFLSRLMRRLLVGQRNGPRQLPGERRQPHERQSR
jgi:hypothetical protein